MHGNRTLIDIDLLSDSIIHDVIEYKTIDNLSDHLPLFVLFKYSYTSYAHALPRNFNARPNWRWTDHKTIIFYKAGLDIKFNN